MLGRGMAEGVKVWKGGGGGGRGVATDNLAHKFGHLRNWQSPKWLAATQCASLQPTKFSG